MRVRCGFYCLTKVRQIASRGGCDLPRLLWTEVITCHLTRPPVASALAAVHGIRRGLHAAPPAPADAFGRRCASCCSFDLRSAPGRAPARRLAQGRSVRSVPSRRTRMRAAPTQKPPIASAETPHLLPPPMADDPIHNRDEADRRPARRSSTLRGLRACRIGAWHDAEATYRKRRNASPASHPVPNTPSTTAAPSADPPGPARRASRAAHSFASYVRATSTASK